MFSEREHDLTWGMATPADAIREYAYNAGMDNPDQAWILTDYDVWMPNPHYKGPPVPHPEDDAYPEDYLDHQESYSQEQELPEDF